MNDEKKKPETKKILTLVGILVVSSLGAAYLYHANEQKKADRAARLQGLMASQPSGPGSSESLKTTLGQGATAPQPPAVVEVPAVSDSIKTLLDLGARRAKAEATSATNKAEAEATASSSTNKKTTAADQGMPKDAFLMPDEMPMGMVAATNQSVPAGTGITFNEANVSSPRRPSIEQLTLRYAARVDGKLTAYVSVGEAGRMIPASVGKVVDGVKITSINEKQLCAEQGKSTRCITMSY